MIASACSGCTAGKGAPGGNSKISKILVDLEKGGLSRRCAENSGVRYGWIARIIPETGLQLASLSPSQLLTTLSAPEAACAPAWPVPESLVSISSPQERGRWPGCGLGTVARIVWWRPSLPPGAWQKEMDGKLARDRDQRLHKLKVYPLQLKKGCAPRFQYSPMCGWIFSAIC